MAKKRSRSMENDTETIIEFSQLFITPTLTATNTFHTPSAPPATSTATAAAATKTVLRGSNQDEIRDDFYYHPPGWTGTVVSPVVGGEGRVRPRVDESRPSWPPVHRINNSSYYHP